MQVFKTYFKLLKKQLSSVIIYGVLFLFLCVMITSNINVENTEFKASKVRIMVINEDGENAFLEGFLTYLGQYADFVPVIEEEDARKDSLFFRRTEYILTIPKGFTERFTQEGKINLTKEDIPDSMEAISVDNAINNYLNIAKVYLKHVPGISYEELSRLVSNNLEQKAQVTINAKTEDSITFANSFNMNYFNYLGYVLLAVLITGVSMVMYSFHGLDIRRRHTASPITSRSMNFQLILANLVFVLGYLIIFVIAGYILNKDRIMNPNICLTWINAFIFTLTSLSISYLIGITVKSVQAVQAISTVVSLSLSFISGVFVPQAFLGKSVLKAASFTPTFWYVKANNSIAELTSFEWSNLSDVIGYMGIQLGFAAAIISIALVVSKRKRTQTI